MAKSKEEVKSSKAARIAEIKKKLEKDFGEGTIIGAKEKPKHHDAISTGSIGLDKAIGIGGLPRGRIIEIYGPESSGKTTLCLEVIAQAHKADPESYCAIVDAEHAIDTVYAEKLGVDLNRLEICQPDFGEQALEIADRLAATGDFDVIVVDSVAALVPKGELEGEMGDSTMGKQARLMSQACRKLTPSVAKGNCIFIFVNQLRDKIGVMMGNPETTTGGNALKFYASVRLDVRRKIGKDALITQGDDIVGNPVTVKVVKNKVAPPFKKVEFQILYGEGIDVFGEVMDVAVDNGIIGKSGSYYSYDGSNIAQGKFALRKFLKDNPEAFEKIKEKVIDLYTVTDFLPAKDDE